jgi:hypothetical protein
MKIIRLVAYDINICGNVSIIGIAWDIAFLIADSLKA